MNALPLRLFENKSVSFGFIDKGSKLYINLITKF